MPARPHANSRCTNLVIVLRRQRWLIFWTFNLVCKRFSRSICNRKSSWRPADNSGVLDAFAASSNQDGGSEQEFLVGVRIMGVEKPGKKKRSARVEAKAFPS